MKKSKFLGAALTLALAFGLAFGTYAINKSAVNVVPNNHYEGTTDCEECIPDAIEPGFVCNTINSGIRCTCDFSSKLATTEGTSKPECLPLYKNVL